MAAVFVPSPHHYATSSSPRLSPAQARFALALAASALIHIWLAAGTAFEAPARLAPRIASALTARLEPAAASSDLAVRRDAELSPVTQMDSQLSPAPRPAPPPGPSARAAARHAMGASPDAAGTRVTAFEPPHVVDPTYYSARELDAYPTPISLLKFEYPVRAARENLGGRVLVMLLLDATGTVDNVSVVTAEPPGYFEDAVRTVIAAARFLPARKDGRAVKSRVLIHVNYDPDGAEGALR